MVTHFLNPSLLHVGIPLWGGILHYIYVTKPALGWGGDRASGVTPALTHFLFTLSLSLAQAGRITRMASSTTQTQASLASIFTLPDALVGLTIYLFFCLTLMPCEPPAASFDNCADSLKG